MIIGISGKKYSGKDTAFLLINKILPSYRFAFADEVKLYASRYFSVDKNATGEAKEKTRYVLQGIGEMFRNEVSKTYWTDKVFDSIAALDPGQIYVITDVRYKNEVEEIVKRGGTVLRITRPDQDAGDSHPSEVELTDEDFPEENIIINDGTIDELSLRIKEWMDKCIIL